MRELPEPFIQRMKKRLGEDFPAFLSSYERPPCRGLRVNTLKIGAEEFLRRAPFPLEGRVDGEPDGFYIGEEKPGADPYHFAGLYYLQEPSAMAVGAAAATLEKGRVLDLCAAPGGKTTHVAAQMAGEGILLSNEINFARAKVLSQNVERMGIANCAVTSASPESLAALFPAFFSLILADAPCSGEGMFKKEENAIPEWSEENVARCAVRQRGILDAAAKMTAGGGHIVYSTCTFAEEEDEGQVENFLDRHPEFTLVGQKTLYPHLVRGEGHFCAVLKKEEGETGRVRPFSAVRNARAEQAFREFAETFFQAPPHGTIHTLGDGRMYLVPAGMPDLAGVNLLRLGVELGEWDGKLFKPAHALAMAVKKEDVRRFVSLSRAECEGYLRGGTVESGLADGWCVVGVEEFPLGLGKIVGGTVKNHLPKGLRMYGGSGKRGAQ